MDLTLFSVYLGFGPVRNGFDGFPGSAVATPAENLKFSVETARNEEDFHSGIVHWPSLMILATVRNSISIFLQEPFNLKGVNSFRYNGLIKKKAISIQAAPKGKGVVLAYKKTRVTRMCTC